jgi:hypothetical protein
MMEETMPQRNKKRMTDETTTMIVVCIGAHWPDKFVPEDQLLECVNEFLKMPRPDLFLELIRNRELKLEVRPNEATGHRLLFSLVK